MNEQQPTDQRPLFSVVRGRPSDEELAAVLTVLASRSAGEPSNAAPAPEVTGWSAYWRAMGAPIARGPGAWRASGRSS